MKFFKAFFFLLLSGISAGSGSATLAQGLTPAAKAMYAASAACMRNYGSPEHVILDLQKAGFALAPGMDPGTHEFSGAGVYGIALTEPGQTYCVVQSTQVPLATARAIGLQLAQSIFGYRSSAENGTPEGGRGPCDGLNLLAPQRVIWIHYSQAGNSGECVDDGTSAIIMNM